MQGVTYIDFSDGKKAQGEINLRNWLNDLQKEYVHTQKLSKELNENTSNEGVSSKGQIDYLIIKSHQNLEAAKPFIMEKAKNAFVIKILANKGLEFFGSDSSIISLAETSKYTNLKRLKVILLSPNSSWINRGLMALRKYESVDGFKSELNSTHTIVGLV